MSPWIRRLAILALILVVGWFGVKWLMAPDAVPVRVLEVSTGTVEETVTNSRAGTVTARRRAKLSPEIGGQVIAIPFREGDQVESGAVVLELDGRSQRAQLNLALRDVEAARAEEERACLGAARTERELNRVRKLADDAIVSTDLLDSVESGHLTAAATCRAASANSARAVAAAGVARTEIDKTTVRSPFAGIVAEVAIEVGEWTTPSPPALPVPPVVDILDPSSIYVSAPMDEVDSGRIRKGARARINIDSFRDTVFDGQVTRIAPYVLDIEEQNRTVEVEVDLANPDPGILPGTSADVEIILSSRDDVLRIPTSALIEGDRVLLLIDDHLEERKVETGLRNWDYTEVLGGVTSGDLVVVSLDRPEVKAGAEAVVEVEDDLEADGG